LAHIDKTKHSYNSEQHTNRYGSPTAVHIIVD